MEKRTAKCEYLLPNEKALVRTKLTKKDYSVEWTIENFSLAGGKIGDYLESPTFYTAENKCNWYIRVFPQGKYEVYDDDDYYIDTGSYLNVTLYAELSNGVEANFKLALLDARRSRHKEVCGTLNMVHEYPKFLKKSRLKDILLNDCFTLLCEVQILEDVVHIPSVQFTNRKEDCLSNDLCKILDSSEFSDVIISVGEKEFKLHKAILVARSPVFAAMFSHQYEEAISNMVKITDVDPGIMEEVIRYIYTGKSPSIKELLLDLLPVADKYDLLDLREMCSDELYSQLTINNAAKTLVLADLYNLPRLKEKIMNIISTNARKVLLTPSWKEISCTHPQLVAEAHAAIIEKQILFDDHSVDTAESPEM